MRLPKVYRNNELESREDDSTDYTVRTVYDDCEVEDTIAASEVTEKPPGILLEDPHRRRVANRQHRERFVGPQCPRKVEYTASTSPGNYEEQ
jgi:hypothetical protein